MARYGVQLSDEAAMEVDVSPGMPVLRTAIFEWDLPEGEVAGVLEELGGRELFRLTAGVYVRHHVPITRDGEMVGEASLRLWPQVSRSAAGVRGGR